MIITTKKLRTLVSALDTKESEWDLEEFCQTCEKSLTWRGKDSVARTWKARLKRVSWMKHLYTRTLKPSLMKSFTEKYLSSLEVSPANHSLKQVLKKQLKTHDISSLTLQKESNNADQELFSSKTLKESSVAKRQTENQFSSMSSDDWKKWVTEQRQEYSLRVKSERHIRESESSSWATPKELDSRRQRELTNGENVSHTTGTKYGLFLEQQATQLYPNWATPRAGAIDNSRPNNKGGIPLGDQVKRNWATPQAFDAVNLVRSPEKLAQTRKEKNAGCMNLREQVHYPTMTHSRKDYPTPSANEQQYRLQGNTQASKCLEALARNGLLDPTKDNTNGKSRESFKLNPNWVENLMGIPVGWTDLEH